MRREPAPVEGLPDLGQPGGGRADIVDIDIPSEYVDPHPAGRGQDPGEGVCGRRPDECPGVRLRRRGAVGEDGGLYARPVQRGRPQRRRAEPFQQPLRLEQDGLEHLALAHPHGSEDQFSERDGEEEVRLDLPEAGAAVTPGGEHRALVAGPSRSAGAQATEQEPVARLAGVEQSRGSLGRPVGPHRVALPEPGPAEQHQALHLLGRRLTGPGAGQVLGGPGVAVVQGCPASEERDGEGGVPGSIGWQHPGGLDELCDGIRGSLGERAADALEGGVVGPALQGRGTLLRGRQDLVLGAGVAGRPADGEDVDGRGSGGGRPRPQGQLPGLGDQPAPDVRDEGGADRAPDLGVGGPVPAQDEVRGVGRGLEVAQVDLGHGTTAGQIGGGRAGALGPLVPPERVARGLLHGGVAQSGGQVGQVVAAYAPGDEVGDRLGVRPRVSDAGEEGQAHPAQSVR